MTRPSAMDRFLAKVDDSRGVDACWPWTGAIDRDGYPRFKVDGRNVLAYRWIYAETYGDPGELVVDHVRAAGCRRRDCVNWVRHLEAVTVAENTRRGVCGGRNGLYAQRLRRTGHRAYR